MKMNIPQLLLLFFICISIWYWMMMATKGGILLRFTFLRLLLISSVDFYIGLFIIVALQWVTTLYFTCGFFLSAACRSPSLVSVDLFPINYTLSVEVFDHLFHTPFIWSPATHKCNIFIRENSDWKIRSSEILHILSPTNLSPMNLCDF